MIQIPFLIFLCILTFIAWRYLYPRHSSKYPPMPGQPYPLIGHLPELAAQQPAILFRKWMEKTNGICSVYLGSKHFILISDYEYIKEVFIKQADIFSERAETFSLVLDFDENHRGLAGMHWRDHRSVSLSIMRTLGMGRDVMDRMITDELDSLLKIFSKQKGTPMDVKFLLLGSTTNLVSCMLLGKRFSLQEKSYQNLIDLLQQQLHLISKLSILDVFPWLKYIPCDPFKAKKYIRNFNTIMQRFRDHISRCKEGTDEQVYVNFIKTYMTDMNNNTENGLKRCSEQDLESMVYLFLMAGGDSTAHSILWSLLLAINHPDAQRKIYEEIKEFIGLNRQPTFHDRKTMHYTNAFISESQRYRSITPSGLPRRCVRTTQIGSYTIPEGAYILPCLDHLMHDKKPWGDPDVFRPERFLNEEGNFVVPEYHIPFFLGKRTCLGESIARMELFLYLTSIIQRFSLLPEDPDNPPSLNPNYHIGCYPDPFTVRFVERA